tara:strand:- start:28160 stop:28891 length:732 start_codon:yes stop_codon:yes gene_type:complete
MSNTFFTRRIMATANTLRRVISDAPDGVTDTIVNDSNAKVSYPVRPSPMRAQTGPRRADPKHDYIQPLVLQAPLALHNEDDIADDNAFADIDDSQLVTPANSTIEPVITKSNLLLLTEQAAARSVDDIAPDRIQRLIEEITPVRIANIFAENSEEFVSQAVSTFGPAQINQLVERLAPTIIEAEVSKTVRGKITEHLAQELPGGMEAVVASIVKDEMQGAFGYTVTRKIRQLIREELSSALNR